MNNLDELVQSCLDKGIAISYHNHPKTRANWDTDWTPHDTKSVSPNSPNYRKPRAR